MVSRFLEQRSFFDKLAEQFQEMGKDANPLTLFENNSCFCNRSF